METVAKVPACWRPRLKAAVNEPVRGTLPLVSLRSAPAARPASILIHARRAYFAAGEQPIRTLSSRSPVRKFRFPPRRRTTNNLRATRRRLNSSRPRRDSNYARGRDITGATGKI